MAGVAAQGGFGMMGANANSSTTMNDTSVNMLLRSLGGDGTLEMDEGFVATVLSVMMMGIAAVRLVWWIATYRWLLIGVLTAWSLWLVHAVVFASTQVSDTLDDIIRRAESVHESSTTLVLATQRFLLAWFNLLLPFWSDLLTAAVVAWQVLDPRIKWGVAVVAAVAYSLVTAYRRARQLQQKHGKTVRALLFQASFLVIAPALWFGAPYALPKQLLPLTVGALLSPLPAVYSCVAFAAAGAGVVKEVFRTGPRTKWDAEVLMGRCLSYWACWPSVRFAADMIAKTSFGGGTEVQRALLVLLVWLQVWDGARHVPDLLWRVAVDVGLPVWRLVTTNLPEWVQNPTATLWRHAGTITGLVTLARENKYVAIAVALVGVLLITRVLGAFSSVFTLIIWWGASLKTTRTYNRFAQSAAPHHGATDEYRPMLAFWVLGLAYETALEVRVPVVGHLLALWEPVFLAVALSMGDTVLDAVLVVASPAITAVMDLVRSQGAATPAPPAAPRAASTTANE